MDPTDPVWMQPNTIPPSDPGRPTSEETPSGQEDIDAAATGFVDFAEIEPDEPREAAPTPLSLQRWLWLLLLPFAFTFLLTCLFLAMRGVLDEGGMVAVGGPYEIAHPAPSYWWIFPVAIIGCVVIALASMGVFSLSRMASGSVDMPFLGGGMRAEGGPINLVALFFWPAIFLSLGWNFCEYGLFKTEGLAWGWVVSGVVFVLMGGLPLYFFARKVRASELRETARKNAGSLWPQLIGVAAGIPLGVLFFGAIS